MSDKIIYVLSCTESGGVYSYSLSKNNELKKISQTVIDRPMYAVTDNGRLYVILREPFKKNKESGIVSFKAENGILTDKTDLISTKGEVCCHLCVSNGEIYAANYISGSIIKMPDTLIFHHGSSINSKRQSSPHTHFMGLTPDNKYICVTDLGTDKITLYDHQMRFVSETSVKSGNGPRHIVFSDNGKYAYCANELSSTVTVLLYNEGKMQPVHEHSTIPNTYSGVNAPAAIRYCNEYVYVSNRGHDSITCYKAENDKLILTNTTSCGGSSPRDFNISGGKLICANEDSNNVCLFLINNGTLTKINEIQIEKPLCVVC